MSQASPPWHFRLARQPLLQHRSTLTHTRHHHTEHSELAMFQQQLFMTQSGRHMKMPFYCPLGKIVILRFMCFLCQFETWPAPKITLGSMVADVAYGARFHVSFWIVAYYSSFIVDKTVLSVAYYRYVLSKDEHKASLSCLATFKPVPRCTPWSDDCFGCSRIKSPSTSKALPTTV